MGNFGSKQNPKQTKSNQTVVSTSQNDDSQDFPFTVGEPIKDLIFHVKKDYPYWEFKKIEELTKQPSQTYEEAFKEYNKSKNRYTYVVPFDHCRVKLQQIKEEEGSDYINASYITGISERDYIATQGPLPFTFHDFWRMCWEQQVKIILMLTKTYENGRMKCHQYWPSDDESEEYGNFKVTCSTLEDNEELEITVRKLVIQNTQEPETEPREIYHYQYHGWPDHGVPDHTRGIRFLLSEVDKNNTPNSPIVVHCSAGIGRTGTFCTVHTTLKCLQQSIKVNKTEENNNNNNTNINNATFNIYNTVLQFRNQRSGMVQQPEQYRFCYESIIDGAVELGVFDDINWRKVFDEITPESTTTELSNTTTVITTTTTEENNKDKKKKKKKLKSENSMKSTGSLDIGIFNRKKSRERAQSEAPLPRIDSLQKSRSEELNKSEEEVESDTDTITDFHDLEGEKMKKKREKKKNQGNAKESKSMSAYSTLRSSEKKEKKGIKKLFESQEKKEERKEGSRRASQVYEDRNSLKGKKKSKKNKKSGSPSDSNDTSWTSLPSV